MTHKIAFSKIALNQKIPHGDPIWRAFNGSFENLTLDSMEIMNLIYTGHAFTTWHSNQWRDSANYLLGQHIGIDFDTEDERSTLSYLSKDKFVARYGHVVYTTPSHTPDKPRARVLFLLDTPIQQSANYGLSASAMLWLFGTADRQCKDPCRFFYGSVNCNVEYIGNELPLSILQSLIGQYRKTGESAKRTHANKEYKPSADQDEVAAALKVIPPWGIGYDQWVAVLMGLHAEFDEAGLSLAQNWADGTPGEVDRKWRSFKPGGGVSIASVFGIAKEFGWTKNGS